MLIYPNLIGEMARKGVTKADIAKATNRSVSAISARFTGKRNWTVDEAFVIREALETDIPVEVLFRRE